MLNKEQMEKLIKKINIAYTNNVEMWRKGFQQGLFFSICVAFFIFVVRDILQGRGEPLSPVGSSVEVFILGFAISALLVPKKKEK